MQTRSRTRKRTLDTAEETDEVLDIPEKLDFEDLDSGTKQKEPVNMEDRIVQADPALMDFSRPKIDDISQASFIRLFKLTPLKSSRALFRWCRILFLLEERQLKTPTCI